MGWTHDELFTALPVLAVLGPEELTITFTASLQAEQRDLAFTLDLKAPSLERTFPLEVINVHCNTPPGDVGASLDTAMDGSGHVITAFRLPTAATDDDLSCAEISWRCADGSGNTETTTPALDDSALCTELLSICGIDILGTDCSLDRYYRPPGTGAGVDYRFTVVVIDTEGLRSTPAVATSSSTRINGGLIFDTPPHYTVGIGGPTPPTLHYGGTVTFTAIYPDPRSSAAGYEWYLDSVAAPIGTGASLTITPTVATYAYGGHLLLLMITDMNGFSYAGSLTITVEN